MTESLFIAPTPLQDAEIASLRARVGWLCHLARFAAVAWAFWAVLVFLRTRLPAEEYITQVAAAVDIDLALISHDGYWMAFALGLVDHGFVVAFAVAVWRLMGGYLRGDIFSAAAADRLRAVALFGFAAIAASIFLGIVSAALLTTAIFAKAPLWSWVGPTHLFYAVCCAFFLALSAIFKAAAEIADEYAQIV